MKKKRKTKSQVMSEISREVVGDVEVQERENDSQINLFNCARNSWILIFFFNYRYAKRIR